jgi:hypothetical protein
MQYFSSEKDWRENEQPVFLTSTSLEDHCTTSLPLKKTG